MTLAHVICFRSYEGFGALLNHLSDQLHRFPFYPVADAQDQKREQPSSKSVLQAAKKQLMYRQVLRRETETKAEALRLEGLRSKE
jgi:hypothetical protein